MAKIYKISAYLVDPNDYYEDVEAWFERVIDRSELFCPVPIKSESVEFEWDDDLPITYIGCKEEECEQYFKEV
jgi:hypothetical protein